MICFECVVLCRREAMTKDACNGSCSSRGNDGILNSWSHSSAVIHHQGKEFHQWASLGGVETRKHHPLPAQKKTTNNQGHVIHNREIWHEVNLMDWSQPTWLLNKFDAWDVLLFFAWQKVLVLEGIEQPKIFQVLHKRTQFESPSPNKQQPPLQRSMCQDNFDCEAGCHRIYYNHTWKLNVYTGYSVRTTWWKWLFGHPS